MFSLCALRLFLIVLLQPRTRQLGAPETREIWKQSYSPLGRHGLAYIGLFFRTVLYNVLPAHMDIPGNQLGGEP